MKKFLVIVLLLVYETILFVGCSKESTYQPTELENVSISISDVSPTGATIIIKDTNNTPYIYGEWYKIEKEKDGKWYDIETVIDDYCFESIGYIPNDNKEVKYTIDWEWLYGELPVGNYRLLKNIDSQYISIEFNVASTDEWLKYNFSK